MHELINLILASATASIYHAFNFFLQTKVISFFYGPSKFALTSFAVVNFYTCPSYFAYTTALTCTY